MNELAPRPQVFGNRFADAAGPGNTRAGYDPCSCFDYARVQVPAREVRFHRERQDASAPGWLRMLALIDEAAADGREVFSPLVEMSPEERRQVITLPPSVGKLTAVKHLVLYRSNLVRLPPEVGAMTALRHQVIIDGRQAAEVRHQFLGWNNCTIDSASGQFVAQGSFLG